jgi:hypothetical protein
MGRPDSGLLVVADFDTPARAVGLIIAQRRHGTDEPPAPGSDSASALDGARAPG